MAESPQPGVHKQLYRDPEAVKPEDLAVVLRPSCLGVSWEEARKTRESWELELEKAHLVLNHLLSVARPSPLGSPWSAL